MLDTLASHEKPQLAAWSTLPDFERAVGARMNAMAVFSGWRKAAEHGGRKSFLVTIFNPRGIYPRGTFRTPGGVFHATNRLVFMLTEGSDWRKVLDEPGYSEFDWAGPDEIRLMASLVLCETYEGPHIRLYPEIGLRVFAGVAPEWDWGSSDIDTIQEQLLAHAETAGNSLQERNLGRIAQFEYDLADPAQFAMARHESIWSAIDRADPILARAMSALIKSDMLSSYREFGEEALISAYIALDCSFSLVSRRLKEEGIPSPSAHDAAVWLHRHFDSHFGHAEPAPFAKYFEEFYEGRIMTLHPSSRFGEFPYSPTMVDDIFDLRTNLRHLFLYMISGKHDDDFLREVAKFKFDG